MEKTVQNKVIFCCDGTKERNQRMVGFLGARDCPLPCLSRKDHIFDIQAASTNNVTDFPARIFSTRHSQLWSWLSTSIWATWHACLWNGDLCQLYVWLGSCIWCAQQDPSRASEGQAGHSCLLQAEFGLEQSWFSSKMSQSAGPLRFL